MKNSSKSAQPSRLAKYLALSLGLSIAGHLERTAFAATATWTGATNQDWNTTTNYSLTPTGNNLVINTSTGNFPIITADQTFTPVDIFIGSTGIGRLDHTAGAAATGNGNWIFVGANSGTGTYNLANTGTSGGAITGFGLGSGSLTTGRFNVGGAEFNGTGLGVANINTSGTLTANNGNGTAVEIGFAADSMGTVNLDNGTINASGGELWVGVSGTGVFNQAGGAVSSASWFVVGRNSGGVGTYNLSGGTINASTASGNTTVGALAGGTGIVNVNGGTFNATNAFYVGEGGTGTLNVSGTGSVIVGDATQGLELGVNAGATGVVNLNGGTIRAKIVSQGAGAGTFNFNGGTLQAGSNSTTFMTGVTQANVMTGGAVIDSNGFDVTIGQTLLSGTTNDGGLTKKGTGSLSLTGTLAYTGTTNITAGTLRVNTLLTGSPVAITGGTLAGSGTTAAVRVNSTTGSVSNGTGSGNTSTLTIGSLTFGSAGSFTLNKANDTSTVALAVTGSLTTLSGVTLNITTAPTWTNGSTYNLISYGSLSGTNPVLGTITGLGARQSATISNTGTNSGFIRLAIAGDTPFWTGSASNVWTTGTIASPKNWKLVTAGTPTDFLNNDQVLFNDNATGTTSVVITGSNVGVASVTFNNNTKAYTISGTNGFGIVDGAAAASVIKSGTGKVTLTSTNGYTGGTTINAGTVAISNANSLGATSGAVAINNGATLEALNAITSSRNFLLSGSDTIQTDSGIYQVDGTLSNNGVTVGSLVKSGTGTLLLTAPNSYSGGTTINQGTLQINTTAGLANTGTFNLNGGKFLVNTGSTANFNYSPTINLLADSTFGNAAPGSTTGFDGQINYTGTFNGNNHVLNVSNTGLARLYLNSTANGISLINILAGAMGFDLSLGNHGNSAPVVVSNGASLWFANATNALDNTITLSGGTGINGLGALYQEGGGNPTLTSSITLAADSSIGGNTAGATVTLFGSISGTGALTKLGANTYNLFSPNSYSGPTTIAGGALLATDSGALSTGAVSISAVAGAQLQLGSGVNMTNPLTINGGGATGQSALYVPSGDAIYNGLITITGTTQAGGHFATNGGTLNLTGTVTSGTVPVSIRAGTVVFSSTNNNFSTLNIQAGTAAYGVAKAIPIGTTVNLGASGSATLDLAGFNSTLVGLTQGANSSTVTNNGTTDVTLTTTGTSTYAGVIADGVTNKIGLTVSSGALTLAGASTFTGNVNVNGGTLFASLSDNVLNPTGSALGNPQIARNIIVNNGGTLNFIQGDTFGGATSDIVSTLVINAGGTVSNGGNNFTTLGPVQLNGGTLTGSGGAIATFQMYSLRGTVTVGGTSASTISGTGTFAGYHLSGTTNFNVADVTSSAAADVIVSASLIDQTGGQNSAPGSLTKSGSGTMTLSGNNSYTGGTTVSGGVLNVVAGGNVGKGNVSVLSTAVQLTIQTGVTDAIGDTATLSLAGGGAANTADVGFAFLGTGVNETVGGLVLGGVTQTTLGTYGSLSSSATFKSNEYWSGTGIVTLAAVPEPSTWVMLISGVGMLISFQRRRRVKD